MYDDLERITRTIAAKGFWREGWIAIRQTRQFDAKGMSPDIAERLAVLDAETRPRNLIDRIHAIVLSKGGATLDLDHDDVSDGETVDYAGAWERMEVAAQDFGRVVANDKEAFGALLSELVAGEGKLWMFGRGLCLGTGAPREVWDALAGQFAITPPAQQNVQVLCGFLAALNDNDATLPNILLDEAVTHPALAAWLPALQIAVPIDAKGVERLKQALALNRAPIGTYRSLQMGRATDPISGADLKDLLRTIAVKENGYDISVEILSMRLFSDHTAKRESAPEVLEIGRELLGRLDFANQNHREDHNLNVIARASLKDEDGAVVAADILRKLMEGKASHQFGGYDHHDFISAIISEQPIAALDTLFGGDAEARRIGSRVIEDIARLSEADPLAKVPDDTLIAWCDRDAPVRYPFIASVITPFSAGQNADAKWTDMARLLLRHAPDRLAVFKELADNFEPNVWSGSRATLMESRLPLLNDPEIRDDPALTKFVEQKQIELKSAIEVQRRYETERDQQQDERFE
jgi:hypothetical protein